MNSIVETGVERFFHKNEMIISKTDLKGRITYANDVFLRTAGYSEGEVLGEPHSMIRHPDMPRCVFKLLWDTLNAKNEIFAYVINLCKNGDYYWVFAHVTPSFDMDGNVIGYHSTRRVPDKEALKSTIVPLYKQLLEEENKHSNRKEGMNSAFQMLLDILKNSDIEYDEFIFSIS